MAKRRMAVTIFLVCFCFLLTPCSVKAASTTNISTPINENQDCSLSISYVSGEKTFENISVKLYKIATVSSEFQYTLTPSFASTGLVLNGISSNDEWNIIRSTLEAYIIADNITEDIAAKTNSEGIICFDPLKPGLYLAITDTVKQKNLNYNFEPALVSLPNIDRNEFLQYQVSVASKSEIIPPQETDQEIQLNVVKLWKDKEGKNNRPKSVAVEIFKNGKSYKKVTLTNNNNWSYSWSAKQDGTKWTVIERNTPTAYTMRVEKRGNSFLLTNTLISKNPNSPTDAPQTGDTINIMFYVVLMLISGSMLIILGFLGKRNAYEKHN